MGWLPSAKQGGGVLDRGQNIYDRIMGVSRLKVGLGCSELCKGIARGHRLSPAGLPIEQVLGDYPTFFAFAET